MPVSAPDRQRDEPSLACARGQPGRSASTGRGGDALTGTPSTGRPRHGLPRERVNIEDGGHGFPSPEGAAPPRRERGRPLRCAAPRALGAATCHAVRRAAAAGGRRFTDTLRLVHLGHDRPTARLPRAGNRGRPAELFTKTRLRFCAGAGLSKVQSVDQRMRLECGVGFRQLRTCRRTRPGQLCATSGCEQCSKAAPYSITSSASASKVGGKSRPSARAVVRLTVNSNLLARWIGRSAGFSPLRIRPV